MEGRVAPRQLLYQDQLPLAISSRSHRRIFHPEGANEYGASGGTRTNIIRIPISADSMLDAQHSYLQFTLHNTSAADPMALDITPASIIRRIRLESAGSTLEEIVGYNKLYNSILFPAQADFSKGSENSMVQGTQGRGNGAPQQLDDFTGNGGVSDGMTASYQSPFIATLAANTQDVGAVLNGGSSVVVSLPIVCGLLNMEKYVPLVMMSGGLVLEIELDNAHSVGYSATRAAVTTSIAPEWKVSEVRYVAHLIDLEREFYDRMRAVMEGTGGVLQLASQTYRNFQSSVNALQTSAEVSIPNRVKSVKSIFWCASNQAMDSGELGLGNGGYASSSSLNVLGGAGGQFQFRIGSVLYPPTAVRCQTHQKSEALMELNKAFGSIGFVDGKGSLLTTQSYGANIDRAGAKYPVGNKQVFQSAFSFSPFGLDFEAFPRTALESGVNTADFSLPTNLILSGATFTNNTNINVWVLADAIFYVNMDGSVSVSV